MNTREGYLFWRLAYYLISDHDYRIIKLTNDQNELWLEKTEDKRFQCIRLLRYDLDWSNWLQRDIERTALNGESIRKQVLKGEMNVLNLYITAYPPVDDYQSKIEEPYMLPDRVKTKVITKIIDRASQQDTLSYLEERFGDPIPFSSVDIDIDEIEALKREALSIAATKAKEEESLFEYGKPFFTYFFIMIQIAMFFVLEAFGGSTNTKTLIQFGAKFNPLILEGEWWRFFTPIILHIGFLHLFMNTLALFYLGTAVEKIYGRSRFLFIYLAAGFGGSIASFMFSPNLSAGASGAIFGCFGALLYFGLIYPKLFFRTMGLNIFIVLAINLSFGFTVPGIDNAGHIGGLIGGFLATGIVHFPKKKKYGLQILFFILSILTASSILGYGFQHPSAVLNEPSVLMMSQEYIQAEEYEKAYSLLMESVEENPTAQYYFLLSFTEIKLGKLAEAEKSLLKVIEIDPRFHEAYFNLALVYLDQGDAEKARHYVEKAVDIEPNQQDYNELLDQLDNNLY
ncbi:rhomboid family protein [Bacillus dakarensis]|uniref:rhomboid family protein n=1 Tax=Robertmurraya dakarensis TaxID=1926278 RepID=UPI001115A101|nr:rhomboid family intramembrane serine protease [Bacillus dakarensis]